MKSTELDQTRLAALKAALQTSAPNGGDANKVLKSAEAFASFLAPKTASPASPADAVAPLGAAGAQSDDVRVPYADQLFAGMERTSSTIRKGLNLGATINFGDRVSFRREDGPALVIIERSVSREAALEIEQALRRILAKDDARAQAQADGAIRWGVDLGRGADVASSANMNTTRAGDL